MKRNTIAGIIIFAIAIFLCLVIFVAVLIIAGFLNIDNSSKEFEADVPQIEEEIIQPLCEKHGFIKEEDYNRWFDMEYMTYSEAKSASALIFPQSLDCKEIEGKASSEFLTTHYEFRSDGYQALVTFHQDSEDDWRIYAISIE